MKVTRKRIFSLAGAILFGLLLTVLFSSPSWSSGKARVAVIDFEQKAYQEIQGKQIGEIISEWLITALVNTGRFEVVERSQLQKVLKEQQMGMTGMVNQETAAKVGELLGVKVIITGSVIQIGNTYDVNARLISVEDGSILKAERIRGAGLESMERMMESLADSLKKDFPLEGYVVLVSGKRAMIDLGRTNGVEPGMRFSAFRKGPAVRHPISGKMLAGEDIRIGDMVVQSVERESSWAEIVQEEPGSKVIAGSVARQVVGEKGPVVPPPAAVQAPKPIPAPPSPVAPAPPKPPAASPPPVQLSAKGPGGKILVEWAGKNDLLLGDDQGYVTLYLNLGTPDSPRYDAGTRLRAAGKEIKVRGPAVPYLVDWNEDGRPDLLVGNSGGYLHLFLNQGSAEFAPGVMVQAGGKNVDVGGRAAPCVADWNGDGKKDLVMGNSSGEIFLYLNEGSNEQPAFGKPIKLNGGRLDVGSHSSPDFVDWDGDGKKDLVIGNSSGEILVYLNKGTDQEPQFSNDGDKLPLKLGEDASPQVLKQGGRNHLVVSDRFGEVTYLVDSGAPGSPDFSQKRVLKAGKK